MRGDNGRGRNAANAAQSLYLSQSLLFLVDAHGDELDDRLSDAHTALQFKHPRAVGLNGQQNVVAVVEKPNEEFPS